MVETNALDLDQDAVRSFAEKLSSFLATLEPAEADALTILLRRAATADDDVVGYAWWDMKDASGWADFLSSALLGVVIAEGMVLDQHVLEHFYGRAAVGSEKGIAAAIPTSDTALRSAPTA